MPQPGFQFFAAEKPANGVRIFVLGESTTAGFPYSAQGSFANLLRLRLEPHLAGRPLEVVNCGITALNSYAVAEFVEELAPHEPDLYVVYLGHNEFYGALGPASRVAFGRSRELVQGLRWVLDLRLSRTLARGLEGLRGSEERVQGQTLMGAMVGQTGIRRTDPIFGATLAGYESNLRRIVSNARGVPVVFCEVVSNLRDQPPFESLHAPDFPAGEVEGFAQSLQRVGVEVVAALAADPPATVAADVATEVERLVAADPGHAAAVYTAARLALLRWCNEVAQLRTPLAGAVPPSLPDSSTARPDRPAAGGIAARGPAPEAIRDLFVLARDLDAIRFRAPSEINATLRKVTAENQSRGVGLVPLEEWFVEAAAYGIPGFGHFVEHLHFNLEGADLAARAIVARLGDGGYLGQAWRPAPDVSGAEVRVRLGLTGLDHEVAERRVFHLTHRWPYPEDRSARFRSSRPPLVQELAQAVIDREIDLAEAHFRLGETWFAEGRRDQALEELMASCAAFPVIPRRFLLAGRLALEEGKADLAVELLTKGAALDPTDAEISRWRDRATQAVRSAPSAPRRG